MQPNNDKYIVILAGGIGSRFWPISKYDAPKQFLDLLDIGETLLQATYQRHAATVRPENIFVLSHQQYAHFIKTQLPELPEAQLILEPVRKSTAACLLYALHKIQAMNANASVFVSPADHVITHQIRFEKAMADSQNFIINNEKILVWATPPTRPETNYTYIQYYNNNANGNIFDAKTFAEYPTNDIAEVFCKSGEFLWNTGIFAATLNVWLRAYQKYMPDMYELFARGNDVYNTLYEQEFIDVIYPRCQQATIKRGVLCQADNVSVLRCAVGWSKLHTWQALYQTHTKDYVGNAVGGNSVVMYDSSGCVVKVPNDKLVIIQGLDDYIIADSDNALLICKKTEERHLKNMTNLIARKNGDKFL